MCIDRKKYEPKLNFDADSRYAMRFLSIDNFSQKFGCRVCAEDSIVMREMVELSGDGFVGGMGVFGLDNSFWGFLREVSIIRQSVSRECFYDSLCLWKLTGALSEKTKKAIVALQLSHQEDFSLKKTCSYVGYIGSFEYYFGIASFFLLCGVILWLMQLPRLPHAHGAPHPFVLNRALSEMPFVSKFSAAAAA